MEENLKYGERAINLNFRKYFTTEEAKQYAYQAEKIANRVYGGRMGNTLPGDGWLHRGRGYFQITGKDNYTKLAKFLKKTVEETIKYLTTIEGAMESSMWFWSTNNLNVVSDKEDGVAGVDDVTNRVNGGLNGEADREDIYKRVDANV